jgi:hypothetical protein
MAFSANYPGCVALVDTSGGPACAADLEPLFQCEAFACSECTSTTDFDNCIGAVQKGACSTYFTSEQSSCATEIADGGSLTSGACSTDQDVINVVCGSGAP